MSSPEFSFFGFILSQVGFKCDEFDKQMSVPVTHIGVEVSCQTQINICHSILVNRKLRFSRTRRTFVPLKLLMTFNGIVTSVFKS